MHNAREQAARPDQMDRFSYYEAIYRFASERRKCNYQEGRWSPECALFSVMAARGYDLGATGRGVGDDNTWRKAKPHAADLYDAMVADQDTGRRWQRKVVEAHGYRYFDTR